MSGGNEDFTEQLVGGVWRRVEDFGKLKPGDIVRLYLAKEGGFLHDHDGFHAIKVVRNNPTPSGDYDTHLEPLERHSGVYH